MENGNTVDARQIASTFGISRPTASKYMEMTEDEIQALGLVQARSKRPTPADDYLNIIYKMQRDGYSDDIIAHYVVKKGYSGNKAALLSYIYNISVNNFPDRQAKPPLHYLELRYPRDVTVIKRGNLLKYILTIDPEKKRDGAIKDNIGKIKEKSPIVDTVEKMFLEFYTILMGENPDAINGFVERYGGTEISVFCDGIKKDISAVRNAVSMDISSGFVEGNNNKFKLIKRTLYGRAELPSLTKKCKLAFLANSPDFSLVDLI